MDLLKHENTIKELVDSFQKMCNFIETSDTIGCEKCPLLHDCFYKDKHKGLNKLIEELK